MNGFADLNLKMPLILAISLSSLRTQEFELHAKLSSESVSETGETPN